MSCSDLIEWLMRIGLLILIGARLTLAAGPFGIFTNQCALDFFDFLDVNRREAYEARARQAGYTAPLHIEEFVQRQIRARYLQEEAQRALNDERFGVSILEIAADEGVFQTPMTERRRQLRGIAEKHGQQIKSPRAMEDTFPFVVDVLRMSPPKNLDRKAQLQRIFGLRVMLHMGRNLSSQDFAKVLPSTDRMDRMPQESVRRIIVQAYELPFRIAREHAGRCFPDSGDARSAFDASVAAWQGDRFGPLAPELLARITRLTDSRAVPETVKDEIRYEVDYRQKYGMRSDPLFDRFVGEVEDYFQNN